jgi:hypothetical protein
MSVDENPATQPLASPALLRKVDELREKNVSQHVPLPQVRTEYLCPHLPSLTDDDQQLVVVGDQSSGKSSLLES